MNDSPLSDSVQLSFLGAFAGVTGSKSLLEWQGQRFLVDCGLFQGPSAVRQGNWQPFPIEASSVNAVFLTHAHLDHVGYLPRLYSYGFRGPIYCSEGTLDLARIILMDSAHLEEETARYAQENRYSNHEDPRPLFTIEDAEAVLKLFKPIPRYEWHEVAKGLSIRLLRAGHIIGASMVELSFSEGQRKKIITFSGDIGHDRSLILREPDKLDVSDVLILESTYGNRLHDRKDPCETLAFFLNKVIGRKGVAVIPAFAVGRSQELLYMISLLEKKGIIPSVPVVVDSPMSEKALSIYFSHSEDQPQGGRFGKSREDFLPKGFETSTTADDSMLATMMDGPAIVISASGMLSGGRILHHLKKRLPDAGNMVIFVGYQADGSKGRFLQDNSATLKTLRIHHQEVEIAAEIVTIENLSAHADYEEMLDWLRKTPQMPEQVLINHGEPEAQRALAATMEKALSWKVAAACDKRRWVFPI